jgi:hypothetical protein
LSAAAGDGDTSGGRRGGTRRGVLAAPNIGPDNLLVTPPRPPVRSVYLSPTVPRLRLESEADLQVAASEGLLVENHFLELKREIPPGKGNNQELAADLASLAVDGGTIMVGVAQRENDAPALVPQPLDGMRERIAEVARTIPDPPLPVTVDRLPSAGDDAIGYLVIHVPASPNAPHMVGCRYWGRGDATKFVLSDPEVRRLHALHRDDEAEADAMIRAEIDRDPIPEGLRVNVRGSVVKRGKTTRWS